MACSARSAGSSASAAPAGAATAARPRRRATALPLVPRLALAPAAIRQADSSRDLDRAAGAQVEEVEQVRAARDEAGVDRHVRRAAALEQRGAEAGRGQAGQLDGARGDLAVRQGAEVAAQPAARGRAAQVVEDAEGQRAEAGHGEGSGGGTPPFWLMLCWLMLCRYVLAMLCG